MWVFLALLSALGLGIYEVFKKEAVRDNDVLTVLALNTVFGALIMSPVIVGGIVSGRQWFGGDAMGFVYMLGKALIVLTAWGLSYSSVKQLPLTITGPINATSPVLVLMGGLIIYGEQLSLLQWAGMILGFASLYFSALAGSKDGFSWRNSRWMWVAIAAMLVNAMSGLYDKFLLRRFEPIEVQACYSLMQCLIMCTVVMLMKRFSAQKTQFHWRWAILGVPVFLTAADLIYYNALSQPDSMISIVSMIRRSSVVVSFLYGAFILHEKNLKTKIVDLALLFLGLVLIILGSN